MATRAVRLRVYKSGGQVSALQWKYYERDPNTAESYEKKKVWTRENYEQWAQTRGAAAASTLSFTDFVTVFRIFMMGTHGNHADIPEAFHILDTDHSNLIDLNKLAVFMPFVVENGTCTPEMLLPHVQKVDKDNDNQLNLNEFTDLIMEDIGIQIALGRN